MTHHRDTDRLEDDQDRQRETLEATLDELKGRLKIDNLASDALGLLASNGNALTRSVFSTVRANPVAAALTAAGVAWMVFGSRPKKASAEALMDWEDEGGLPAAAGEVAEQAEAEWSLRINALRRRASVALRRIEEDARHAVEDRISAGLDVARDFAAERAEVLADFAKSFRSTLAAGLEDLNQTARDKVIEAREAAYGAALQGEKLARQAARTSRRAIEDHPMVAGALALALGAAVTAAFSRGASAPAHEDAADAIAKAEDLLKKERAAARRRKAALLKEIDKAAADVTAATKRALSER